MVVGYTRRRVRALQASPTRPCFSLGERRVSLLRLFRKRAFPPPRLLPAATTSFPLPKLFHVARLADAFSGCALNGFGCLKYMTPTRADLVRRIRTLRLLRASATNGTTMLAAVECVVAKLDKQPWKLPCDPECGRPIHL